VVVGIVMIMKRLLLIDPLEHPLFELSGIFIGGMIVIFFTQSRVIKNLF
jgi:hypothetical protein